jgi:transposase
MAEGKDKGHRRNFSRDYKRRIVRAADTCKHGELTRLLEREGLYASQLSAWRRELGAGDAPAARAASEKEIAAKAPPVTRIERMPIQIADDGSLEHDIARWRQKIEAAEQLIEAQKALREAQKKFRNLDHER